jgi:hypothetical protein
MHAAQTLTEGHQLGDQHQAAWPGACALTEGAAQWAGTLQPLVNSSSAHAAASHEAHTRSHGPAGDLLGGLPLRLSDASWESHDNARAHRLADRDARTGRRDDQIIRSALHVLETLPPPGKRVPRGVSAMIHDETHKAVHVLGEVVAHRDNFWHVLGLMQNAVMLHKREGQRHTEIRAVHTKVCVVSCLGHRPA